MSLPNLISLEDGIFVAGHKGMVGSAISRSLRNHGYRNLLIADRKNLDLMDPLAVNRWFAVNKPSVVILAAAKVGGILANDNYPVQFLLDNIKTVSYTHLRAHET